MHGCRNNDTYYTHEKQTIFFNRVEDIYNSYMHYNFLVVKSLMPNTLTIWYSQYGISVLCNAECCPSAV